MGMGMEMSTARAMNAVRAVGRVALAGLVVGVTAAEARAQVALGVRAGVGSTTIAWSPSPIGTEPGQLSRRRAFTGGAVVSLTRGPFRFGGEVLYTGKGFSEEDDDIVTSVDIDYFEVPLLIGWSPSPAGAVRPEVYAGPWLAFEARCRAKGRSPQGELDFACDEIPGDEIPRDRTDWGAAVGLALLIDGLSPLRGLIDLRYSASLNTIDAAPEIDNIDAKHRGFSVSLGLMVPTG